MMAVIKEGIGRVRNFYMNDLLAIDWLKMSVVFVMNRLVRFYD